jgi:hypothetical protein
MNAGHAIGRPIPTRRLRGGGAVLAALWILLVAVYTLPLWIPRFMGWDYYAIWVEPPGRQWMAVALGVILLLLPPLVLAIATWRWMRRQPRT